MQLSAILESLFRWTHVVSGILWIGLLYFFNWVNSAFAPKLDADTRKKVVPELMPRALYWFRWGAAWTWTTGVILIAMVFYHGRVVFDAENTWNAGAFVMIAVVFLAPFFYDALMKSVGKKNMKAAIAVGFVLVALVVWLLGHWARFSYRGYVIHTGTMFGTIMAFNVWFRIWPAQKTIIGAVKNGEPPPADLVALAGTRSRHNTYLSIPLVWTMINQHTIWANTGPLSWLYLLGAILLGWWIGTMLFKRAPKVAGF